ncbi:hypothetical protein HYT59_01555 [Candidatus Woesebacteria bacterium]|nr:hypothetical protein [Candidatus Woesebacteria bacterium]
MYALKHSLGNLKMSLEAGALLFKSKTILDNKEVRPKFFILAEGAYPGCESLVVFLTTSKKISTQREIKNRGVIVSTPVLPKQQSLVLLQKYFDVPLKELKREFKQKGRLSSSELNRLVEVVKTAKIPSEIKERVLKSHKYEQKAISTFKAIDSETAEKLKARLERKTSLWEKLKASIGL